MSDDTKPPELPLILLAWHDHWTKDGWFNAEDACEDAKPALVYSVGWLRKKTKDGYFILSMFSPSDDDAACGQFIVKGAVINMIVLAEKK